MTHSSQKHAQTQAHRLDQADSIDGIASIVRPEYMMPRSLFGHSPHVPPRFIGSLLTGMSNVFLSLNVPMGLHADMNNMAGIATTLIPLSRFDGGQLYVCDPEGDHKLETGGLKGNIRSHCHSLASIRTGSTLCCHGRGPTSYWARIIYVMLVCFLAPIESFLQSWVATSARGSLRLIRT